MYRSGLFSFGYFNCDDALSWVYALNISSRRQGGHVVRFAAGKLTEGRC